PAAGAVRRVRTTARLADRRCTGPAAGLPGIATILPLPPTLLPLLSLPTSGERAAVLARCGAENLLEVAAQVRPGTQPDVRGDLLNAALGGLQQLTGPVHPRTGDPLHRGVPGVREELPREGSPGDGCGPRERLDGQRLHQLRQTPLPGRGQMPTQ